ncbi:MAG: SixA phosphatase family protein [Moraxellaceae bacterium]
MKIILVRHGQAEDESRPDSARQLTDFGRQQVAQTAEYVTTYYSPDYFVVSPYDRAQQTLAEFQLRAQTVSSVVQDNITPADDARQALIDIGNIDAECLVVVCHMSIVAYIAGLLTGDYPESFSLAEARVFEMDFVMAGIAKEVDRFLTDQT